MAATRIPGRIGLARGIAEQGHVPRGGGYSRKTKDLPVGDSGAVARKAAASSSAAARKAAASSSAAARKAASQPVLNDLKRNDGGKGRKIRVF
jgi:hypothetical protein